MVTEKPGPNDSRRESRRLDLDEIEQGRRLLGTLGSPVEFWEALCLSGSVADGEGAVGDPLNSVVKGAIHRGLRQLREELGTLARELRFYFERLGAGFSTAHAERVIGFILASDSEREAARRWLTDPQLAHEAADRIAQISHGLSEHARPSPARIEPVPARLLRPLPEPLEPEEADAALSAVGCPEEVVRTLRPDAITVPFEELPASGCPFSKKKSSGSVEADHDAARLDPEKAKDIQRARAWTELCRSGSTRVELWEAVFLLSTQGESVRPIMEDLLRLGKSADSPAFKEGTAYLSRQIQGIRSEWGWFAGRLRGYLEPLFKGRPSEEVFETALGFLLSAAIGRERAIRWLDQPDRYKAEAEAYMKTVLEIAERSSPAAA